MLHLQGRGVSWDLTNREKIHYGRDLPGSNPSTHSLATAQPGGNHCPSRHGKGETMSWSTPKMYPRRGLALRSTLQSRAWW